MVRLTDRPDMTLDVYRGRKTKIQHIHIYFAVFISKTVFNREQSDIYFEKIAQEILRPFFSYKLLPSTCIEYNSKT